MRVYHFTSHLAGMAIIREQRLRLSRILALNDPFEMMATELTNKKMRASMKALVRDRHDKDGFISFSENWTNPVQWAHYADSHRGLCLGFDVDDRLLMKIRYSAERLPAETLSAAWLADDQDEVLRHLFTKFDHWHYEQEQRAICRLREIDDDDGHYYAKVGDEVRLREVIVGVRNSSLTRREIEGALNGLHAVTWFPVRPAFRTFSMTKQIDRKLWPR